MEQASLTSRLTPWTPRARPALRFTPTHTSTIKYCYQIPIAIGLTAAKYLFHLRKHHWHPEMFIGFVCFLLFKLDNNSVPPNLSEKSEMGLNILSMLSSSSNRYECKQSTYNYLFEIYLIKLLFILFCCWKYYVPDIGNHWKEIYL